MSESFLFAYSHALSYNEISMEAESINIETLSYLPVEKKRKTHKKNRIVLRVILWPFLYLVLIMSILASVVLLFHSTYFTPIFVSGFSMYPTLNSHSKPSSGQADGSIVDFGIIDESHYAMNRMKRFSIVTTYYSEDYDSAGNLRENSTYKIKRVISLGNEYIEINKKDKSIFIYEYSQDELAPMGDLICSFEGDQIPYSINYDISKMPSETVKMIIPEGEKFVMGDNWVNSSDCFSKKETVKDSYLIGVLVAIEGTATLTQGGTTIKDRHYTTFKFFI